MALYLALCVKERAIACVVLRVPKCAQHRHLAFKH
jgi:hypothetical protein